MLASEVIWNFLLNVTSRRPATLNSSRYRFGVFGVYCLGGGEGWGEGLGVLGCGFEVSRFWVFVFTGSSDSKFWCFVIKLIERKEIHKKGRDPKW